MTLEEAQSLRPGDQIKGTFGSETRTIRRCKVEEGYKELMWGETESDGYNHSWSYDKLTLHKRAEPQVNDTYAIY